jgi:predicted amidohydrolase
MSKIGFVSDVVRDADAPLPPKTKIRVCQIDTVLTNFEENVMKHVELVKQAMDDKISLVVFPELSLTGYNVQDAAQDIAIRIDDVRLKELKSLSKKISILCGAIELSEDFGVYNAAFFFENSAVRSVHRKIYLPTYGMFEELRYFSAGNKVEAFESTRLGKIGVSICEDNWHISVPYLLAVQGAKLLVSLVASPLRMDGTTGELRVAQTWEMMNRTYANLLSVFVVCANRVGNEDGLSFWGGSEIISPDGQQLAKAPQFEEAHIDADFDLNAVKRARLNSSHFLDEDVRFMQAELERIVSKRKT